MAPAQSGQGDYLDGLNEPQRQAVEMVEGPVLVLAGAGTGKTRVLTSRIAHLLTSGLAGPGQILAVTFTNKAAREMQLRVARLLNRPVEGMAIGTFHSVSARILRYHAELVGLKSNFTILDTDDQIRLLKQIIKAENIDDKRWPARMMAALVDRWKNRALGPLEIPKGESHAFADGRGAAIYKIYQDRLKTLNAVDFGDLLLHTVNLFRQNGDVLKEYQNRYRYILVDEYQDTNLAQYMWLRLLAQGRHNICCVGDDDQSIYGWRGAEIGNILKFEKDFPGARIVRLEQNYRSTGNILGGAAGLIDANKGRLGKTLWTSGGMGEPIRVLAVWDGRAEARRVSDLIEELDSKGARRSEAAILVRAGHQALAFEERFIQIGMPYRVIGGPRFYERREIRDAIAYLRVIAQPLDDLAFERIVNTPKRGLGAVTLQKVHLHARAGGLPLTQAARELAGLDELTGRARSSLSNLLNDFERWREKASELSHTELAELVLEESGYVAMWQNDKAPDAPGKLENLQALVQAMSEFENLEGFLEHITLVMDNQEDSSSEKVSIMTLHGAKGLEFDNVFLPGWEEGMFPNQMALDEKGLEGLEEERRLAYVGLTRAGKRVYILHASSRLVFGQWQTPLPSRFLDELPAEFTEVESVIAEAPRRAGGFAEGRADWNVQAKGYGAGWNRARQKTESLAEKRARSRTIEGRARRISHRPEEVTSSYAIGERIFHEKFGYGIIEDVDGNKLDVMFETSGLKRIVDSFVAPASEV
ncbi:MAG: UvrD-helicase domain-containing protein [Sphingomonadales bacterium]